MASTSSPKKRFVGELKQTHLSREDEKKYRLSKKILQYRNTLAGKIPPRITSKVAFSNGWLNQKIERGKVYMFKALRTTKKTWIQRKNK